MEAREQDTLVALAAHIVTAYVAGNHVQAAELPQLLRSVHATLQGLGSPGTEPAEERRTLTSTEIRRSMRPEGLTSFEDGKAYKTLRRHLARHGLTPQAYRTKWGLPADYPMTAPAYSAQRAQLARDLGLGRQRRVAPEPASSGSHDPVGRAEVQRNDEGGTSASQMEAKVPDQTDQADEFDEGITREPFGEDGAEP